VFALSRPPFSSQFWFQPLAWRVMAVAATVAVAAFTEEAVAVVFTAVAVVTPLAVDITMPTAVGPARLLSATTSAATITTAPRMAAAIALMPIALVGQPQLESGRLAGRQLAWRQLGQPLERWMEQQLA